MENIFVDMIDSGACYMFNNVIEIEDFLMDLFYNSERLNLIKNKAKFIIWGHIFNIFHTIAFFS